MRVLAPTLEKQVEGPVVKYARSKGVMARKMNGQGNAHWPDRLFILPKGGRVFWIEFKRPGGELSPGQEAQISDLRDCGQIVYVCDDPGKGKGIVDAELSTLQAVTTP